MTVRMRIMSTRLLPAAEQKTRLVIASKTARYPGFGRGFFTRKRLPRRRFSPACNALPPCMRPPPKPNTAHAACRGPFIKLGGLSCRPWQNLSGRSAPNVCADARNASVHAAELNIGRAERAAILRYCDYAQRKPRAARTRAAPALSIAH